MNLVILTTDTPHHLYFCRAVARSRPIAAIFLETRAVRPTFETFHPFERERDAYERDTLLGEAAGEFADLAPVHAHDSLNAPGAAADIRAVRPDAMIIFGTGKLDRAVFGIAASACLNLHGGDPSLHRGLDSHLWAIYERRFDALVATLHHVDDGLDTGDICRQERLSVNRTTKLHELRAINTRHCFAMTLDALNELERDGRAARAKLARRGNYYSFMPAELKAACVERFDEHVRTL